VGLVRLVFVSEVIDCTSRSAFLIRKLAIDEEPTLRSWNLEKARPSRVILKGLLMSTIRSNSRITILSSFSWAPSASCTLLTPVSPGHTEVLKREGRMLACLVSR